MNPIRAGLIFCAIAASCFSTVAHAGGWTVTDLGSLADPLPPKMTPPPGYYNAMAFALNDSGQVTGQSNDMAFVTGANGQGIAGLSTFGSMQSASWGTGINATGQIVGYAHMATGENRAFFAQDGNSPLVYLGTLGGSTSYAQGVNDAGQIVGASDLASGQIHGFITRADGSGMTDLGAMGGTFSQALAINNGGQVAGVANPGGSLHAFLTGPNGENMVDLGTLGGSSSQASALNGLGQVVGSSSTSSGGDHAFVTGPNGQGMIDLGVLNETLKYSEALGINNLGQVVGWAWADNSGDQRAFITDAQQHMIDLNSEVALSGNTYLTQASAINDRGQVIAYGSDAHAYLLTPVPEPGTFGLMVMGLGMLGLFQRKRVGP